MAEQERDYSLKKSFEKLGALPIPILADGRGNVIDGVHRELIAKELGIKIVEVDVPLGVLLKVALPTKNPTQSRLVRIACNDWRRPIDADERARELIALRQAGLTPQQIAEKTAYTYRTVLRYLPDKYKDSEHAKLGVLGGKATAKKRKVQTPADNLSATPAHPSQLEKPELPLDETQEIGEPLEQKEAEETVKSLEKPVEEVIESNTEFAERFTQTFQTHLKTITQLRSHLNQITQKDCPTIISYMDENKNCDKCVMRKACTLLTESLTFMENELPTLLESFVSLKNELPACMKQKLLTIPSETEDL